MPPQPELRAALGAPRPLPKNKLNAFDSNSVSLEAEQRAVCERHGAAFDPPSGLERVGIALSTLHLEPLNGLRHRPAGGTCGWYLWGGGELPPSSDFFQALHVQHLPEVCAASLPFLALPPGYRFLLASEQEDVWVDPLLLNC